MTWNHEVTLQDGTATITGGGTGEPPAYYSWAKVGPQKQQLLETAVKMAPLMVDAAIDALLDYARRCDVEGKSDSDVANEEAWVGLPSLLGSRILDTVTVIRDDSGHSTNIE